VSTDGIRMDRRVFLKLSGMTGLAWLTSGFYQVDGCGSGEDDYASLDPTDPANFTRALRLPGQDGLMGVLTPTGALEVTAATATVSLIEGYDTTLWAYQTTSGARSYINPSIYLRQGDSLAVNLVNGLNEDTILHWHGLDVDWRQDGNPSYQIQPGESYAYSFGIRNRGGTYWYHPHPHMMTAEQAYRGLSGLMIVEDDDDVALRSALNLTFGQTDIPLVLQDKRLDSQNQLAYTPDSMEEFDGYLGDISFVNMTVNPLLEVATRIYRLRILNGSNARILRLAFTKGDQAITFSVIGTDGGLLERAYQAREVFLSPAERVDVLLDLSSLQPGDEVFLRTLQFDAMDVMSMRMASERNTSGSKTSAATHLEQGEPYYLLKLAVTQQVTQPAAVPSSLSTVRRLDTTGATVRPITLSSLPNSMTFTINGQTYDMDAFPVQVTRGSVEVWEVSNQVGRNLSSMAHPLHIHGALFQVIDRQGSPAQTADQVVDSAGRFATDLGWKDTVLVWPGETVRLAMDFTNAYPGEQNLMLHCHILEHEDAGMMLNYKIV